VGFHESGGARDDHRADRLRAADVGIVVDLDTPRRRDETEGLAKRGKQALLACVFGELAPERLPRVLKRVVHEFALLAALRRETSRRPAAR
jgi:hypothetical protein